MKKLFKIIVLLALAGQGVWSGNAYAAACTSAATGNWSAAATWGAPCNVAGGPTSADTVTIAAAHTVTVDADASATSITVNAPAAGGNGVTLSAGVTLNVSGAISMTAPAFNGRTSTFAVGSSTLNAASITINGGTGSKISQMTVSTGTITTTGNISFAGTAANARFTSTGASTVNVGGNFGSGGTLAAGTGTINFNGGAAQTTGAYTYNNVTITNTAGGVSPAGALTINGIFDVNTGTFTVQTGTVTIAATGTVNIDSGGIVNVAGTNITVNGPLNVSGTIDQTNTGGSAVFVGLVTVNNGGIWQDTAGESVTFRGGITNNGSFTAGTGIYTFNTNSQSIGGSNTVTIPSVTVTGVTLTNNGTLTVGTALTGTGGLTNSATGTLNIGGTNTVTTLTATASGNTVNYYGVAQTAKVTTYDNLTLSGSGAKTFATTPTVNNVLSMEGTATAVVTVGVVTYGANATLQYNTATARTASSEEWITPFAASGGVIISNTGTITLNAAKTLNSTAPLTINNGATLADGGFVLTANGDISNSGTHSGTSSITLSGGAAAHTLSGNGTYGNLILNDANGATLGGSPTISGVLTLTSGVITTGANVLEVSASCATGISGGSSSSYVLGNLTLHYPAGTTACTFPIGSAAAYAPAAVTLYGVTSSLANSSLTASTTAGDHADTTAGASGIDPAKSVNRYWTLTPGGSLAFATYDATFTFVAGDIDGGAATASFIIGRKNGSTWSYPTMGAKNPTNTTATGMTQAGGFGAYVIGERIMPSITMLKSVAVYWDPVNLLVNPKFIPGAVAQYTVIATNSGGPADKDLTYITDPVPTNTALYVNDIGGPGPVLFTDGATSSTLNYTYPADIDYYGSGAWGYTPVPGADGCDTNITNIRINPKGTYYGSAVAPQPSFQLEFRVCVK